MSEISEMIREEEVDEAVFPSVKKLLPAAASDVHAAMDLEFGKDGCRQ